MSQPKLPLIILLGPTAVGKTELSLNLADTFDGEIISADSRLLYRGMDIGTAKPAIEDRRRINHHLIDVAAPDDNWGLGRYKQEATTIIRELHHQNKIPFLVGGTGQYIQAITEGWVIPELEPDPRLREVLFAWADEIGPAALHDRLASIDPNAADKILKNNLRRTVRALEVIFHTGRRFSELRRREPVPYSILKIGLTRDKKDLYERIDARVDAMIEAGLVQEVQTLLDAGFDPALPSLSAIGYGQIVAHLQDGVSLDEATMDIKRLTKKFVRRQYTWFKPNAPDILWFDMEQHPEKDIETTINNFLKKNRNTKLS